MPDNIKLVNGSTHTVSPDFLENIVSSFSDSSSKILKCLGCIEKLFIFMQILIFEVIWNGIWIDMFGMISG